MDRVLKKMRDGTLHVASFDGVDLLRCDEWLEAVGTSVPAAFFVAVSTACVGLTLNPISSVRNGDAVDLFDQSAAEIVKFDAASQRMFVVNGAADAIDIFDASDVSSPRLLISVDLSMFGNLSFRGLTPIPWPLPDVLRGVRHLYWTSTLLRGCLSIPGPSHEEVPVLCRRNSGRGGEV
jgi:hypothetical protein